MHENEDLVFCPVSQFLALAFADGAFDAGFSISNLDKVRVSHHSRCQIFPWREEMLDIPIFSEHDQAMEGHETLPTRPWSYESFQRSLSDLGRMAGFKHAVTAYALRREAGNIINRME